MGLDDLQVGESWGCREMKHEEWHFLETKVCASDNSECEEKEFQ